MNRRKYSIIIYDTNMNTIAYLDKAVSVWYNLTLNQLYTCGFSLAESDPKNKYCQPYNYAELFDGFRRVELFRIMPTKFSRNNKAFIKYECEHVAATLMDNVMFKYHQVGNLGFYTSQVIRYILDKQKPKRWALGHCEFNRQFEYKWENENLLAALFSVAQPMTDAFKWEYDTTTYPWKISLVKPDKDYKADIQYKKNLDNIEKKTDPRNLATRIYLLGFGEGDNQLTVESVNNGLPYIEKNVGRYGLKETILTDRRFEHPKTLLEYGRRVLNDVSEPYITYEVKAADLHRKDPRKHPAFMPGDLILVRDKEDDRDLVIPIVSVKKADVTKEPLNIDLEVANKSKNITGTISELQNRARINDTYAQGATNLQQIAYADNADAKNPLKIKFYIPAEMARINKLILNYTIENFRSYAKGVEAGGAIYTTTGSGGGTYKSTTTSWKGAQSTWSTSEVDSYLFGRYGGHNHGIPHGTHIYDSRGHYQATFEESGNHVHDVPVDIPGHDHSYTIQVRDHTHSIEAKDHSHPMEHGIYQGGMADWCRLKVDGTSVNNYNTEVNIVPYLSKDNGGKIRRGTWHTVEIVPNKLTRINASLFVQLFTTSRGGGDF